MTTDLPERIISEGLDDWVPLLSVRFLAEKAYPSLSDAALQAKILESIDDLLDRGLVEIGEITDAGFRPWHDPIDQRWRKLTGAFGTGDEAQWGFIAWLRNTVKGTELAHGLEARRS